MPGRRSFFRRSLRTLTAGGIVAAGLGVVSAILARGRTVPAAARGRFGLLRPPGALAEDDFLARCIRCTECLDACRAGAIRLFPSGSGAHSGTPYILPDEVACNLCLDCGRACPSGAIHTLSRADDARMGTAVVDERLCVSHNGTGVCGACFTVCPLKNRAITQDYRNAPLVHPESCVGCGLCEEACIVKDPKAIRVVTGRTWAPAAAGASRRGAA